jgi:hypothetical protein
MKRKNHDLTRNLKRKIMLAFVISVVLCTDSLNNKTFAQYLYKVPNDSSQKWIDWNVLFNSKSTFAERTNYMEGVKKYIIQYIADENIRLNKSIPVEVNYVFCPCDSLLYNLSANTSLSASGTAATTPPKPPGTGGSGDIVDFLKLNQSFNKDYLPVSKYKEKSQKYIENVPSKMNATYSKVLAIMDTGLDSTLFANHFQDLLWTDPTGQPTLRNFQFFNNLQKLDYYYDDDKQKHGSAVTSLALEVLRKYDSSNTVPRVMVLKVLDSNQKGTTFTVSCALSYAFQKKATLINASLGYYSKGPIDSVLQHYVDLCKTGDAEGLPIVAAAGNIRVTPAWPFCKTLVGIQNALTKTNLFFPGSFSKEFSNVICVTSLQSVHEPCFYQNYSSLLVTMGVLSNISNSSLCCSFPISFYKKNAVIYEGASFATPVVSGRIMAALINNTSISWSTALRQISMSSTGIVTKSLTYISP